MTSKRQNRGFTMMEMLIAVAILVILFAVAFIGVINYRRSMKQLELDRIAQEIYVAAQNHLTQVDSEGLLKQRTGDANIGESHEREVGGKKSVYHYFYKAAGTEPQKGTVLYDMLPPFSLEEGVRKNGSYVIEYDYDSATVINVFYSDQSDLSTYSFSSGDYTTLFESPGLVGEENSTARRDGTNTNNQIIGWFGGDDVEGLTRTQLYKPEVEIKNEEKLYVKVSLPTSSITRMMRNTTPLLQVFIKGDVSGEDNQQVVNASPGNALGERLDYFLTQSTAEVRGGVSYRVVTYVLDDVTDPTKHFATQWCGGGVNPKNLIPGEDVRVWAQVSSNSTLSNVATSAVTAPENSLYGKVTVDDLTQAATAEIVNFRHLENLDPKVSAYALSNASGTKISLKSAVQTNNLSWSEFLSKTNGGNTQVHPIDSSVSPSKAGTYLPVNPNERGNVKGIQLTSYDGQDHYIDGVKVDSNATGVGLFGTLNGCSVSKLDLRNFDVKTSNAAGTAGALAGTIVGASNEMTVSNVLVRETDGATHTISGVGAGGLVGMFVAPAAASTINGCAAATIVTAEGLGAAAGGLVGISQGNVTISHCYAGGHTKDGVYDADACNVTITTSSGLTNSRAGGLVGGALSTTISHCYATTSVAGTDQAGGLVGFMSGGSVANCYATGLVKDTASTRGALIGHLGTDVTVSNNTNTYYGIINGDLAAVGSGLSDGITAFDTNIETFNAYMDGHESPKATPYDETLTKYYNNVYPLKTIKEMDSNAPTSSLKITEEHFGDWPSPETIVVNTAT